MNTEQILTVQKKVYLGMCILLAALVAHHKLKDQHYNANCSAVITCRNLNWGCVINCVMKHCGLGQTNDPAPCVGEAGFIFC